MHGETRGSEPGFPATPFAEVDPHEAAFDPHKLLPVLLRRRTLILAVFALLSPLLTSPVNEPV